MPAVRLADPASAAAYPLPVTGPATWQRAADAAAEDTRQEIAWQVEIPLPELGPGTLLVPSCVVAQAAGTVAPDPRHQWRLTAGGDVWELQEVPATSSSPARRGHVSTHIDCFHVHKPLRGAALTLLLHAGAVPERYLLAVTARPLTMSEIPPPTHSRGLSAVPPPRSQTTAPAEIASRICSPTSVSMVLALWQREHQWLELADECYDPVTRLYGVWPLALAAAARRGCIGAVETFSDWSSACAVLERGIPLVTSIRFGAGELPGAPLDETGGHLVVVHQVSPATIGVCDPAAPPQAVVREYPADAFGRAWLRHRGAAYILPP